MCAYDADVSVARDMHVTLPAVPACPSADRAACTEPAWRLTSASARLATWVAAASTPASATVTAIVRSLFFSSHILKLLLQVRYAYL